MSNSEQLIGILNPRRRRKGGKRRRRASAKSAAPRRRRKSSGRRRAAPASFGAAAPRRRRRRAAGRRRKLGGRRNPGALVINGGLMATIKSAAPIVLGVTGGLVGTRMVSGLVERYIPGGGNPWIRAGVRAGVAIGGAWLVQRISRKAATSVLIGGGVSTLEAVVQAASPEMAAQVGLGVVQPAYLNGIGLIQPEGMNGIGCSDLVAMN